MLMNAKTSALLLIDMQERLLPAMSGPETCLRHCLTLVKAAKALEVPILASEQYPKGLGPTVDRLKSEIGNAPVFPKLTFSAWREGALRKHLIELHEGGRPQVIVGGIEAHVCVLQSAIDLAAAGFGVCVVAEAIAARAESSVALAQARMRQAEIMIVNTEMVVFELLGTAGTPAFKSLSALIK